MRIFEIQKIRILSYHRKERNKMPFFIKRLTEYFLVEIVLASLSTMLFNIGIIHQTRTAVATVMLICLAVNIGHHVYCLTEYINYVNDLIVYLKTNLTVLFIFAGINVLMAYFNIEPIYTFLFLPYKIPQKKKH